jgi:hypothetical protein
MRCHRWLTDIADGPIKDWGSSDLDRGLIHGKLTETAVWDRVSITSHPGPGAAYLHNVTHSGHMSQMEV